MAKSHKKNVIFEKGCRRVISRTAINLKFKMQYFQNEGRYWAETF